MAAMTVDSVSNRVLLSCMSEREREPESIPVLQCNELRLGSLLDWQTTDLADKPTELREDTEYIDA
jgi:hypothetical protein